VSARSSGHVDVGALARTWSTSLVFAGGAETLDVPSRDHFADSEHVPLTVTEPGTTLT
jgi:hypothetical protein